MVDMWRKILSYIKSETVLVLVAAATALSMFWEPPSAAYLGYIDLNVIALLFCLMTVVAGFQNTGVIFLIAQKLLRRITNTRSLAFVLVFLSFFSSMWITNDVALITFVPLSVMILALVKQEKMLIPVVVLQTIAANLGSMLTPIGNPQNLYLYSFYQLQLKEFIVITLPVTLISALLLWLMLLLVKREPLGSNNSGMKQMTVSVSYEPKSDRQPFSPFLYGVLFLFCLGCVVRYIDYRLTTGIVLISVLAYDRSILKRVDYALLLTFVFFFIFVGNINQLSGIKEFLATVMEGKELWISLLTSQIISNVPSAVLLAPFSEAYKSLILGTNVGGLGTLIASLASLISFKIYCRQKGARSGKYLLTFTIYNLLFMAVIIGYLNLA
jgi:Na+/H+ antiporter NhaD/arsenite permease-like protein